MIGVTLGIRPQSTGVTGFGLGTFSRARPADGRSDATIFVNGDSIAHAEAGAAQQTPRPDLCIMHHGHNMQTFEMPGGILSSGRSTLLGPLGHDRMAMASLA
ncbi:hypothetical protein SRABI05_01277 [Agrobacterium fabrum]|uniref:hypothetical protein n=1 Tax=Agrobacterium fabrum TaxID=1176649 RepID=UPI001D3B9B24|nr:hypothetical protein [Agrobacterium fabrum]CAH0134684.1 hypothetical protein SRABI46_00379 [Agrobacterium fabrum]CAH0181610.1 hypothetical protein SRABI05_01277 [Agrobacterium fabrum]